MQKAKRWNHLLIATFSLVAVSGCLFDDIDQNEAAAAAQDNSQSVPGGNSQPSTPSNPPSGQGAAPPAIYGSPNTAAIVNVPYVFEPQAIDPDNDELTFSIGSKPLWATFNSRTGKLSGTPDSDDLGTARNIQISVSDGRLVDRLPAFSINVQPSGGENISLSWEAPVEYEDGSPLGDLGGFRIYYGTAESSLNQTVDVNTSGVTSYTVENLTAGTWYFALTSVSSKGIESDLSQTIAISIG